VTSSARQQERNCVTAQAVVGALLAAGVQRVVVCPGSRSTPLVAALQHHRQHNGAFVVVDVVVDERSAGFFAVGAARVSGAPVAVVTTSGTAVANLLPAMTEAHQEGLVLVALTANRPPQSLGTDDNQVVPQRGMFATVTTWSRGFDGACDDGDLAELQMSAEATVWNMAAAWSATPGPVHLDVSFEKPLEPCSSVRLPSSAAPNKDAHVPLPSVLETLGAELARARRPVLAVGRTHTCVKPLIDAWPGVVVTDVFAGVQTAHNVVSLPNALVASGALDDADVVVQVGGSFVSKDVQLWKRRSSAAWWRLEGHARVGSVVRDEHVVRMDPAAWTLPTLPAVDETWLRTVREAAATLVRSTPDPHAEMAWAQAVVDALPSSTTLLLGNSSPVRDVDDVCRRDHLPERVIGNRGASGIDGLLATAAGAAASGGPVVALVGDLSALHDAGSLFLLRQLGAAVCVVVVNNAEGGIFRRLPIAAHDDLLLPFFLTPHTTSLVHVAGGFGIEALQVDDVDDLRRRLVDWRSQPRPLLLEVVTDGVQAQTARESWRRQQGMS